jgi:hypothetical protein
VAIPINLMPFGLRDVKVTPLGADGSTPGSSVDLPSAQTFSFAEAADNEVLRGDDVQKASHETNLHVEWSLEAGGISLEAYVIMAGGTVTSTGVTPNVVKTYTKLATQTRPYFKVEGQAINDNGGDMHGLVYKCKATDNFEGEMADGSFWITKAGGTGFPSTEATKTDRLYDFIGNETAVAIT